MWKASSLRTDLVMLPPAEAAARAAFESSVRAAWLVQPRDPFEREGRWLAHLKDEEDYLHRQIKQVEPLGTETSPWKHRLSVVTQFREEISALLSARGYKAPFQVPNFRDMLRSLGAERTYLLYSTFSQTSHGTHSSTWLYRSHGLGTQKIEGEFVPPDRWNLPLNVCRFVFRTPATIVLTQLGGDATELRKVIG
jgi:Family of unknown function (DUF5677)